MFTSKKTIGLVVVTLLLVIVPISVYLAQREQRVETRAQDATGSIFGTVKDKKSQSGATGIKMLLQKLNTTTGEYTHVGTIFTTQTGEYQFTGREYGEYSVFPDPNATTYTVKQPLVRRITLSSSQADHYFIDFTIELKTPQQPSQPNPQQPGQNPNQQPQQPNNQPGKKPPINRKEESIKVADPQQPCKGVGLTIVDNKLQDNTAITIPNPLCLSGTWGVKRVVILAVQILLTASALISFFILIWSGIQYILSGGDAKAIGAARGRITFAIIGLAISFLAFIIFIVLGNILGFNLLKPTPTIQSKTSDKFNEIRRICEQGAQTRPDGYFESCVRSRCNSSFSNESDRRSCEDIILNGPNGGELRKSLRDIGIECNKQFPAGTPRNKQCLRDQCNMWYTDPVNNADCKKHFGVD